MKKPEKYCVDCANYIPGTSTIFPRCRIKRDLVTADYQTAMWMRYQSKECGPRAKAFVEKPKKVTFADKFMFALFSVLDRQHAGGK